MTDDMQIRLFNLVGNTMAIGSIPDGVNFPRESYFHIYFPLENNHNPPSGFYTGVGDFYVAHEGRYAGAIVEAHFLIGDDIAESSDAFETSNWIAEVAGEWLNVPLFHFASATLQAALAAMHDSTLTLPTLDEIETKVLHFHDEPENPDGSAE